MSTVKQWIAGLITAILIALLLVGAGVWSWRKPVARTPEDCLEQMFQAMKAGDVPAYLSCFTGELRERLEKTASDQTAERFSEYLKDLVAPVKGRAIYGTEQSGSDRVRLVVDRVYERRQWEYQGYRLRRESDSWKIYAIDPAEVHEPPVPYGTPVFPMPENEPETSQSEPASR